MSIIASRLSSSGVYQVNELDEVTAISGANTRVTPSTVYASQFDEVTLPSISSSGSISLNGTTQYATVPASNNWVLGTGDFTIEWWQYMTSQPANPRVFSVGNYAAAAIAVSIEGGTFYVWEANSFRFSYALGTYLNQWNHFAISRISGTTKVFRNGTQIGSSYADTNNINNNTSVLCIGQESTPTTNSYFPGYISNFHWVKGTGLYSANFTPSTTPLTTVANTQLLCFQSNITTDASPNNLTITTAGTPTFNSNTPFASSNVSMRQTNTGVMQVSGSFDDYNIPAETYWKETTLLLKGDGTNGAQNNTFVDYSYPGGYAVSFDGTNSTNLLLGGQSAFSFNADFTIELWFNAFGAGQGTPKLYESRGGGQEGAYPTIEHSGTSLVFRMDSAARITTTFSYNTWNHVAVVRSGTTITMYLNGTSVGTYTKSGTTLIGTNRPCIGAYPNFDGFNGLMSNLRVVKGTALYTSNFTPSNQPLTAVSGTQLLTCQSATIVDNSPNAFTITANGNAAAVSSKTITCTGNVAQGTFSPFSLAEGQWSNYFDGSGDYLSVPSNSSLAFGTGQYTVEQYIYATSAPAYGVFFVVNGGFQFSHNGSGYISIAQQGVGWEVQSTTTLPLNQWCHIAASRDSSNVTRIFLNGVQIASGTVTTNYPQGAEYINYNPAAASTFITGYYSNVRVVNGTALYTANFTPPTSALTAITNTSLLTCQSNRFVDNSSNNFTITRNGDTKVTAFSPFAPSAAYSASTNGGSGYFDGSGDYLSSPSLGNVSGDFTVEFWMYATGFGSASYGTMVSNNGNSSSVFIIQLLNSAEPNRILGYVGNVAGAGNLSPTLSQSVLNRWIHLAIVRSGSTVTMYENGVSVATATNSNTLDFTSFYTGAYQYNGGSINYWFQGYLTNVRLVIGTALYTSNFNPPTAPLTAVANTQLLLNCTNAGIIDNAGKNDIETVGNAQISTSVKKYGTGSMSFNGTTDWLVATGINAMQFTGDFTMEFWVYQNSAATYSDWVQDGNSSGGFGVQLYSGVVYVTRQNVANPASASFTGYYDQWVHIAATRQSGTIRLFFNGVLKSSGSDSTSVSSSSSVWVGKSASRANYANGYIDDLRITKGVARYTADFTPPDSLPRLL